MLEDQLLLEKKNVKKFHSFYFTGGELKRRDALSFAQGYNGLSELFKSLDQRFLWADLTQWANTNFFFFFLSISYSGNLERTVKIRLARELVFIDL